VRAPLALLPQLRDELRSMQNVADFALFWHQPSPHSRAPAEFERARASNKFVAGDNSHSPGVGFRVEVMDNSVQVRACVRVFAGQHACITRRRASHCTSARFALALNSIPSLHHPL